MWRLRSVDLNLLVVFQLLYEIRNTSAVAEKLGVTQPAVSNSLARLRKQLNDDLFERSAQGLAPTAYADKIAGIISSSLAMLELGLGNLEIFDPKSSQRTFRIAMSPMLEVELLPSLYTFLRLHAPGVGIISVGEGGTALKHDLEEGDIDLALGYYPQLQAGFYQRGFLEESYVCVMRDGHPMLDGPNSIERLAQFDHLIIEAKNSGHHHVEACLRRAGVAHTRELHVPSFVSAPFIVRDSDLIVTLPHKFAETVSSALGLKIIEHPVPIDPCWVRMFWHRRYHRDPGLDWIRHVIADLRGGSATDSVDEAILDIGSVA